MNGFLQDLRYALRPLPKSPGFTAVAVPTLALGIAADTVIFSVMNTTTLKSLPFPEPDRLMLVWQTFGKGPDNRDIITAPNYWVLPNRTTSSKTWPSLIPMGRATTFLPLETATSRSKSRDCEFRQTRSYAAAGNLALPGEAHELRSAPYGCAATQVYGIVCQPRPGAACRKG